MNNNQVNFDPITGQPINNVQPQQPIQPQQPVQTQQPMQQQTQFTNPSPKADGKFIVSLVFGILSILLAFFLNIFIIPLAVVGLILGIISKTNGGKKAVAIILNILGMIIAIGMLIFGASILIKNGYININDDGTVTVNDNITTQNSNGGTQSIVKSSLMRNTTWQGSDGSEVVFTDNRINWYKSADDHLDNYYSGTYTFYIGKDAVNYITTELSEYYVTSSELQSLFNRSEMYSESSFVVFDIRYDKFILNKQPQQIERPLVPWFGFLLEDGTFLDVANMNTGTYYQFTKK